MDLNLDATVQGLVMEQRAQDTEEDGDVLSERRPSRPRNRPRRGRPVASDPEPAAGPLRAPARSRPPNA